MRNLLTSGYFLKCFQTLESVSHLSLQQQQHWHDWLNGSDGLKAQTAADNTTLSAPQ